MSVYHQMGYQSDNLLNDPKLRSYAGAISSPVNYTLPEMARSMAQYRSIVGGEVIFDSQLYYPHTELENLRSWPYFPNDYATADTSSDLWWNATGTSIAECAAKVGATSVCSPAMVPNRYGTSYFSQMIRGGNIVRKIADGLGLETLQTVVVSLSELTDKQALHEYASIITRTDCERIYLVFIADRKPRLEIDNIEGLKGAMRLIHILEESGLKVLVGFSSTDMLLWKKAGATSCASGKFFNLRRFTRSRWDPEDKGGGQLAYWMEESLVAYLRESDVARVAATGILSKASGANPFCAQIIDQINGRSRWVGIGWKQFLYWFADMESRITSGVVDVSDVLKTAEQNWKFLSEDETLMEEPSNDGAWIRKWRIAINEYLKD